MASWRELIEDYRLRLITRSCVRCTNAQTPGLAGACLGLMEVNFGGIYYVHCYGYLLEATIGLTNALGMVEAQIVPIELFYLASSQKAYDMPAQSHILDRRPGCPPSNRFPI